MSLRGVVRSFLTTRNFWLVPMLMSNPNKRFSIAFYGYQPVVCNYSEYHRLRDVIRKGYKLISIDSCRGIVKVWKGYFLSGDYRILSILIEPLENEYHIFNYNNKTILDVGGYMGETSVLFASWGARKVIVYEPVPENVNWLRFNIGANNVDAEIHDEGLGDKDCEVKIRYDTIDTILGLCNRGESELTIRLRNAREVIEGSHADIAKIDCEGGERCLLTVPEDVLCLIPQWIIECHNEAIKQDIQRKFANAGFNLLKKQQVKENVFLLAFELNSY